MSLFELPAVIRGYTQQYIELLPRIYQWIDPTLDENAVFEL